MGNFEVFLINHTACNPFKRKILYNRPQNCTNVPVVLPQPLVGPVRGLEGDVTIEELVLPHLTRT